MEPTATATTTDVRINSVIRNLQDNLADFQKVQKELRTNFTGSPHLQNKILEVFKDDTKPVGYFIKGFALFSLSKIDREDRRHFDETKYFKLGVEYYEKATELGLDEIYFLLGNIFCAVPTHEAFTKALEYYNKGAEKNVSSCLYKLATIYKDGKYFPKDFSKAMEYYNRAMENDHVSSFLDVGRLYEFGSEYTEQDLYKARKYYEQAFLRIQSDRVLDNYCRLLKKLDSTVYDEYASLLKEHAKLKEEHAKLKAEHAELSLLPDAPGYFAAKRSFEHSAAE